MNNSNKFQPVVSHVYPSLSLGGAWGNTSVFNANTNGSNTTMTSTTDTTKKKEPYGGEYDYLGGKAIDAVAQIWSTSLEKEDPIYYITNNTPTKEDKNNTALYIGIGAGVLVLVLVLVFVLKK